VSDQALFGGLAFDCSGGTGPQVSITVDLSNIQTDFDFDIATPSIYFKIDATPVITTAVSFADSVKCELKQSEEPTFIQPVSIAPPLDVKEQLVLQIGASGKVSLQTQWRPRLFVAFARTRGAPNEDINTFNARTGTASSKGSVGLNAFFGLKVSVELAGRVGVGGAVGPQLDLTIASQDFGQICVSLDAVLAVKLSASIDLFVKNWTIALAQVTVGKWHMYDSCEIVPVVPKYKGSLVFEETVDQSDAAAGTHTTGEVLATYRPNGDTAELSLSAHTHTDYPPPYPAPGGGFYCVEASTDETFTFPLTVVADTDNYGGNRGVYNGEIYGTGDLFPGGETIFIGPYVDVAYHYVVTWSNGCNPTIVRDIVQKNMSAFPLVVTDRISEPLPSHLSGTVTDDFRAYTELAGCNWVLPGCHYTMIYLLDAKLP